MKLKEINPTLDAVNNLAKACEALRASVQALADVVAPTASELSISARLHNVQTRWKEEETQRALVKEQAEKAPKKQIRIDQLRLIEVWSRFAAVLPQSEKSMRLFMRCPLRVCNNDIIVVNISDDAQKLFCKNRALLNVLRRELGNANIVILPFLQKPRTQPRTNEDKEFRKVMRFFVTYPQSKMQTASGETTVAEFILAVLQSGRLHSREPFLDKIVSCYSEAPDRSKVDINYLIAHMEVDVLPFFAEALTRPEPNGVITPEADMLSELVPRAVLELRWRKLEDMLTQQEATLRQRAMEGAPDEELEQLMATLQQLNEVKKELSMEIGERTITR